MDVLISLLSNIKPQSLHCISAENYREILQFLFCWQKNLVFIWHLHMVHTENVYYYTVLVH